MGTRRDDLEVDSVEGLWLEIAMPKSRGFLVGSFYRPDRSSKYYDEDFMAKLNCILDTATADGKEILLFGDFNCCLCPLIEITLSVNNSKRSSKV